jgi:hypothetical protein
MKLALYNFSKAYSFEVDPRILENLYNPPLKNINKSIKLKILIILYFCLVYFDGGGIFSYKNTQQTQRYFENSESYN